VKNTPPRSAAIGSGQTVDQPWIAPPVRRALVECPTVKEIRCTTNASCPS
jgi:hypothetical protein